MRTSTLAVAFATLASLAAATPAEKMDKRFDVGVTFYGDNGQKYGMVFPTDTSSVPITNDLVVNKVYTNGGGFCTLTGEKGASIVLYGETTKTVDPPQKFIRGSCDSV